MNTVNCILAVVTKFLNTKNEENGDSVGNTFKIRLEFLSHRDQDLTDPNVDIHISNDHANSFYSRWKAIHISTAYFSSP